MYFIGSHNGRAIAIAVTVITGAVTGTARAQSGSAEALFTEGYRLLDAGKISEACEAFEASNRALPGAGTYLAIGDCRARNGQIASAWSAYQAALTRAKDNEKRQFARKRIKKLEPVLSYLTISVSVENTEQVTLTRNGTLVDPMLWNRALPIDGGEYVIEGRIAGREAWRTTVHVPTESGAVTAKVPDLETHTKLLPRPAQPEYRWDTRRKVSVGFAVTSVVAAGAGVWLGLTAQGRSEDAREMCPSPEPRGCERALEANTLSESARGLSRAANITLAMAGASAITAGVLWLTGGRIRHVAIAPTAGPDGFTITASRSF